MEDLRTELEILGIAGGENLTLKELRKSFKRKSLAMLPEKHPTVANAHSQFEEVNSAFVKGGFYLFKNIYRLDTIF